MHIGYVRVSKQEQNEALQRDALKGLLDIFGVPVGLILC